MPLRLQYARFRCLAQCLLLLAPPLGLIGCASVPPSPSAESARPSPPSKTASPANPELPRAGSGRGGYYMDDGPGDAPPEGLLNTPDAEPKVEPYTTRGNKPYVVFGKKYTPITDERPFKQRGIGSWYGKKFHGQKTSSGELYDMYKMSAAHPTLPIPSYARVTNVNNGKQVIVRVNDRGPFHSGRIIDLSYTAALKLGYLGKGSSELEVERLLPADIARIANGKQEQRAAAEQSVSTPAILAAATDTAMHSQQEQAGLVPAEVQAAGAVQISTAPAATGATAAPGYYLQLGTYSQSGNAQSAKARYLQDGALVLPPVEVVAYGLFYRVYSGPFASRAEAAGAAARLQEGGIARPMIVQR